MMESKKSNRYCSVPQCSTRAMENVTLHYFPKNKQLAAEWKRVLRIKKPISKYMNVCSLHFKRSDYYLPDYPAKRRILKEGIIPSENLPRGPRVLLDEILRKNEKKSVQKRTVRKSICEEIQSQEENLMENPMVMELADKEIQDGSHSGRTRSSSPIKRECSARNESIRDKKHTQLNIKPPEKKNTEVLKRSKRISSHTRNKKVLKPFVFVSVEMKNNKSKASVPKPKRNQAALVKSRKFVDSKSQLKSLSVPIKSKSISNVKSVGVQTGSISTIHPENEDIQQISLIRTIDYLRKNLVGHAMKVKGKTFKVNECSISFEDQNSGETKMLVVQPDELVSSGALLTKDIFGSYGINGLLESRKIEKEVSCDHDVSNSSQRYCGNESTVQYSDVEISDNQSSKPKLSCINSDSDVMKSVENSILNISGIKETINSIKNDENSSPVFGKEVKILVNKLPESLVRAIQDGKKVKVTSKNFKNRIGCLNSKFTVEAEQKVIPQNSSIIHQSFSCESCELKFPSTTYLREHMKVHEEKPEEMSKQEHKGIINSIEIVEHDEIQENEISNDKYSCNLCSRTFDYYQSYKFHKDIVHGKMNKQKKSVNNIKYKEVNKEECPENKNSEQTCPECLGLYQNMEKLEYHLLECHKTVLKKSLYKCDICPKIFITYRSLVYHKTKTHNVTMTEDVDIKLKCPECKKLIEIKEYKLHSIKCVKELEQRCNSKEINLNEEKTVQHPHPSYSSQSSSNNSFSENGITIKRKYTLNSSSDLENEIVKEKRFKQNEELGENANSSHQILNRLRDLLGSSDGPNDITIELDE